MASRASGAPTAVSCSPRPPHRRHRAFALEQHRPDARQGDREREQPDQAPGRSRVHQRPPPQDTVEAERGERGQADERPVARPGGRAPGLGWPSFSSERGENRDLRVRAHAARSPARSRGRRPAPDHEPETARDLEGGVLWRLADQRLRDHQYRDAHPGAGQARGQPRLGSRRHVQHLSRAGTRRQARGPGVGSPLHQSQAGMRDGPGGQVRLDLERAVLAGKQQPAAGAPPQLEHQRGSRPDRRVEMLGRAGSAGVDHDQRAAVGVGAEAALEQTRPPGQRRPVDA